MFPFGKRTKFKRNWGGFYQLEPQELEVIGLFLSRDQPHHAAVLDQVAETFCVYRSWKPDGYQLRISLKDRWVSELAAAVESQHITAPRVDQPGDLTFWIKVDEEGLFEALNVQATSGHMEENRLWQVDLTGIQPAYVELTPGDRFDELAAFLDMDEAALRSWASSDDVRFRWNRLGRLPAPAPRDPQYREFSSLVDAITTAGDRTIHGGETDEDVELDGKLYTFISYDNVLLGEDSILVDGKPDPSPDFKTFLINFLGVGATEPSSPANSQET